jgi:hypothetical protein
MDRTTFFNSKGVINASREANHSNLIYYFIAIQHRAQSVHQKNQAVKNLIFLGL